MPGILPETIAGGIVIRDADGNPTNPANVHNAHTPNPTFITSCELTALPSDCTARIEPRQINAIVSELISFAECLNSDGPWNCNSINNLCAAFAVWAENHIGVIPISPEPPLDPEPGMLWFDSDAGLIYVWNGANWVQVSVSIDGVSIVGSGTIIDPYTVGTIDCGTY